MPECVWTLRLPHLVVARSILYDPINLSTERYTSMSYTEDDTDDLSETHMTSFELPFVVQTCRLMRMPIEVRLDILRLLVSEDWPLKFLPQLPDCTLFEEQEEIGFDVRNLGACQQLYHECTNAAQHKHESYITQRLKPPSNSTQYN